MSCARPVSLQIERRWFITIHPQYSTEGYRRWYFDLWSGLHVRFGVDCLEIVFESSRGTMTAECAFLLRAVRATSSVTWSPYVTLRSAPTALKRGQTMVSFSVSLYCFFFLYLFWCVGEQDALSV